MSDRYPAPFSTYLRLRAEAVSSAEQVVAERQKARPAGDRARSRPRKLTWHEQQELVQLEARLEMLETEKHELQIEINRSGDDYRQLQILAGQLQNVEAELEAVSVRWLELSEIADSPGVG